MAWGLGRMWQWCGAACVGDVDALGSLHQWWVGLGVGGMGLGVSVRGKAWLWGQDWANTVDYIFGP